MRPLEGVFVLDLSTLLPGPMATLMLAEAGAEVVKVERPGRGEEMRTYAPKWGRDSVNFALLNRGKKSIAVDLKDPPERERLRPLVERADVVVEQFRPGVMARLGLSYDEVRKINPRAIYCSITGYGQSGPKRDAAGHDLNFIGDTGLLSLSMGELGHPVVPPALIADIAGGAYPAVMNILLALRDRDRTGSGTHIDVAMSDNLFTFMYWALGNGLAAGEWPGNGTDLVTGGTPRYRLYATADAKMLAAAPIEQKFWEAFCEVVGLPEGLRDDAVDPAATTAAIVERVAEKPAEHWRERFRIADCCCSIVADVEEALCDPHFRARGLFSHVLAGEAGARIAALPVPVANAFRAPPGTEIEAPALGAHNVEYF
ncbi:CaiB/BaiF CoA transferase family protein [Lutibaculum baratangense]|uniref:Alpha-methylacyl-CoA racemase n=1 Tax=Lutibaculum baratangense AMV1 TaxID=631454 RepID=V4RC96_9HYPH|nr:CaiB/BaiF CoA-transferase family protein [Lutibaculum baratangense]ESR23791.1 Alpha-methylacyl-CoA racemase [Lutibaculum baratangense AMV1]